MRKLTGHKINPCNDKIEVKVVDKPGAGGANHHYAVEFPIHPDVPPLNIKFQNGPINEAGINGVTQEVLIEICIDRLKSFQSGPYSCRENALALTKLEEAKMWLHSRTLLRIDRGVEGTHTV